MSQMKKITCNILIATILIAAVSPTASANCKDFIGWITQLTKTTSQEDSSYNDYYKMKSTGIHGLSTIDPQTVSELEFHSDIIIEATFEEIIAPDIHKKNGLVLYGATFSNLKVTKVFKGDIKIGDTIKIAEMYFIDPDNSNEIVYYNNYFPSEKGKKYIWFLGDMNKDSIVGGYDYYCLIEAERGRYPVVDNKKSINSYNYRDFNLALNTDEDLYYDIYKEVQKKYMV